MALQIYTLALGNLKDDQAGNNYSADTPVYILKSDGLFANIYSDSSGSSLINQNGIDNISNESGEFTFYVESGQYIARVNGKENLINVIGSTYFDSRVEDSVSQIIEETQKSRGFRVVGTFSDGFTYELFNDVGIDTDGNSWIYVGAGAPNKAVSAGTMPSAPDYKQVTFNSASGVTLNDGSTVQSFVDNVVSDGLLSWNSSTAYYKGSLVKGSDNIIYVSSNNQSGNDPVTDNLTNWSPYQSDYLSSWYANGDGSDQASLYQAGINAAAAAGRTFKFVKAKLRHAVSSTLTIPEKMTVEFEQGAQLVPLNTFPDGQYVVNIGKEVNLIRPQIWDSIEKRRTINGIRAIDGSPVAGNARIVSPQLFALDRAIYLRGHNNQIEFPLIWNNNTGIYIGTDPFDTTPGGPSGSAYVVGGRIHDNNFGIWQSEEGIDAYFSGTIFEYNRRHIHTDGNTHMVASYLKDAANIGVEGSGKIYVYGSDFTSLPSGNSRLDGLPFPWDSSNGGSDFSSTFTVDTVYASDMQIFCGQPNVTPRDRWAVLDNGTFTLNNVNVQMNELVTSGAKHLAVAKSPLSAGAAITQSSSNYPNYVSNGLFTDTDKLSGEYIHSQGSTPFTVDPSRKNPWGGSCLQVYRTGIRMRYSTPNWDASRRYLLIVLKGEVISGTGQPTGLDLTNSDLSSVTSANLTTNKATSGNAVCISGVKYSDREVIGCTSFVVTLNSAEGVISLTNTLTPTTGNEEIYGVILTDIESENVNQLEHMPIGWYNNVKSIPYSVGTNPYGPFYASKIIDPANITDGAGQTTTITVSGARLGMFVESTFSLDLQLVEMRAYVSSPDTVTVRFQNNTGTAVDLSTGILRVKVS